MGERKWQGKQEKVSKEKKEKSEKTTKKEDGKEESRKSKAHPYTLRSPAEITENDTRAWTPNRKFQKKFTGKGSRRRFQEKGPGEGSRRKVAEEGFRRINHD